MTEIKNVRVRPTAVASSPAAAIDTGTVDRLEAWLKTTTALRTSPGSSVRHSRFSEHDAKKLAAELQHASSDTKAQVGYALFELLKSGTVECKAPALSKAQEATGVDIAGLLAAEAKQKKAAATAAADTDASTNVDVRQGLAAAAVEVPAEQAAQNALAKQAAVRDSHEGKAKAVGNTLDAKTRNAALALLSLVDDKFSAQLPPELQAAKAELGAQLAKDLTPAVLRAIKDNPATQQALLNAANLNDPAFAQHVSNAIAAVVGDVQRTLFAPDAEAVGLFARASKAVVDRLAALGHVTAKAKATVEAAAPAAEVASEAIAASATVAAEAGTASAQAAASGAKAALGRAIPGVHVVMGVFGTFMAITETIAEFRHEPRDWRRISISTLNLCGQITGVVLPMMGVVSTAAKLAADKALSVHDAQHGKRHEIENPLAGVVQQAAAFGDFSHTVLSELGHSDAAGSVKTAMAALKKMSTHDLNEQRTPTPEMMEALLQTIAAAHSDAKNAAEAETNPKHKATAVLVARLFEGLQRAVFKAKRGAPVEDVLKEAMAATGFAAAAQAATAQAQPKASAT